MTTTLTKRLSTDNTTSLRKTTRNEHFEKDVERLEGNKVMDMSPYLLMAQQLTAPWPILRKNVFICPIAIAYSMGQIIKSFCVCPCVRVCVCVSVCGHSHGRISSSIFTKLDTDV